MKHSMQEKSAWFFRLAFLVFASFALLSTLVVSGGNVVFSPTESFGRFFGYTFFYVGLAACFYRWFSAKKMSLPFGLLLCFGLRILFVFSVKIEPFSDYYLYHEMAENLVQGKILLSDYGSMFPHTIGFSWLISVIYRLFGVDYFAIQIGNVLIETLTALVLFFCSRKLFNRKIANVVVFLYAISPSFVMYSELLATEVMFGLLLSVLFYLAILFWEKPKVVYGVLFGVVTAILNEVRPLGMVVMFAFVLYGICLLHGKKRWLSLCLAMLCYCLAFNSFSYTTEQLNGQPVASTPFGYGLYVGMNGEQNGRWNLADYDMAMNLAKEGVLSPDEVHRYLRNQAVQRFFENGFSENLRLLVNKFGILWGSEMLVCDSMKNDAGFAFADRFLQIKNMANAFHFIFMTSVLLGACKLIRQKRRDGVVYICIFVMGIAAQHLLVEVQERYSYPALLALMPIAASGIGVGYEKGRNYLFKRLREDIRAVMEKDPAAKNVVEVFLLSPGIHALFWHRAAHRLYLWRLFFLARWISQTVRAFTGIEIHPGAKIGRGVMIDHGMGVVIGETAEVGDGCTIYQNVTLGGTGKDTGKRHPTIGKNVMIGAGAKVLGPFSVGDNSKIAANAVVLREVPENSTCVGVPARIVVRNNVRISAADWQMDQTHIPDPLSQELCRMLARIEKLETEQAKEGE